MKNDKISKIELYFNIFSILFLLIFLCLYGYRFFHYKNVFKPKVSDEKSMLYLTNKIKDNVINEGDGLYNNENSYVYKGQNVNNYIIYSNILFRIIKINKDNTIEIIMDDSLNYMSYDNVKINYYESDLNYYLNDIFYNNIKSDLIVKSLYCSDSVIDSENISCSSIKSDYIKLLSICDYFNSKIDDNSYLDDDNIVWLNDNNNEKVWVLNNGNLSLANGGDLYQVKPIITLNNELLYNNGNGTLDNPYTIKNDNSLFASYIKLDNDLYRVYDINKNILKLQSTSIYKSGNIKYQFSNQYNKFNLEEGLGNYLNKSIYNELSYKDLLVDCTFNIGEYNSSYKNVLKNNLNAKLGINNILDPIFNKEKNNYYLSTMIQDNVYFYNNGVYLVKPNIVRDISLSVCIDKNKLKNGSGTLDDPYILSSEVEQ